MYKKIVFLESVSNKNPAETLLPLKFFEIF